MSSPSGQPLMVTFAFSKKTVPWTGEHASILELAEAHGLTPDYSCRNGICSTCTCELLAGELEYISHPLDPPEEGMALICCTRPRTDVTLNI